MDEHINQPIAHAVMDRNGRWRLHPLAEHLKAVSALAARHAESFDGAPWVNLAGFWHDLGKYRPPFQHYIRSVTGLGAQDAHCEGKPGRVTHSTAGALLAQQRLGPPGRVLAYLIAGHHAGLHDWHGGLEARLDSEDARIELAQSMAAGLPTDLLACVPTGLDLRVVPGGKDGFALWVRLLFSCLVDADFLDTETFMDPAKAARRGDWPSLDALATRYDAHMADLDAKAPATPVNALRRDVREHCVRAAALQPGVFTLTVPPGGGKTLSSMAFALTHARGYQKRRVVYVIPYTSIIEQTADVFRGIFGEAVIEHHSNAEADANSETGKSRLACENWDAPTVVTTSVQFFESLFAARTSLVAAMGLVNHIVSNGALPSQPLSAFTDTPDSSIARRLKRTGD